MTDWTAGMTRSFAYYLVDPATWLDSSPIGEVESCSVARSGDAVGESAVIVCAGGADLDERVVRCYMDCAQGRRVERVCVGTWCVRSTRRRSGDARAKVTAECLSTLCDADDDVPPVGYTVPKGGDAVSHAEAALGRFRAEVVESGASLSLKAPYSAEEGATWLAFASSLAAKASLRVTADAYGRYALVPAARTASLRPSWTFEDDVNASILYAGVDEEADYSYVPNVVQVVWSEAGRTVTGEAVNSDESSPVSTVSRGRRVCRRLVNPDELSAGATAAECRALAAQYLETASCVERVVKYSHAWCPVRVGDCVRIVYARRGIDVTAQVTEQDFECDAACRVTERAVYTETLWRAA